MSTLTQTIKIRWLERQDYLSAWQAMQSFTQHRTDQTMDEIWLLEHHPVFTQGQNGKPEHVLNAGNIPIVQTDRGGQVTYHGPGQLMVYILIDLKRKRFHVRDLVTRLEQSVIAFLAQHDVQAHAEPKAPGVYVADQKICSIGLRIRRWCSYHGLAFNVKMDMAPFKSINPCGFAGLQMTQLADLCEQSDVQETGKALVDYLCEGLDYTTKCEGPVGDYTVIQR